MFKIIIQFQITVFLLLFSVKVYSFSSSSYLIAHSAISFNDYDMASRHYIENKFFNSNIEYLQKKMITLVNANNFPKAYEVALRISNLDINSQFAWMVILVDAILNNKSLPLQKFEMLTVDTKFPIVRFVFYNNNVLRTNKDDITEALLNLVKQSSNNELNPIINHHYFLFYLNLATKIKPTLYEALYYQAQFFETVRKV